jgi:hypothetical protein
MYENEKIIKYTALHSDSRGGLQISNVRQK